METILLLQRGEGRKSQQPRIKDRIQEAGFEYALLELEKDEDFVDQIESWISKNKKPVATLRWDEHQNVFGKQEKYKKISSWGWQNNVAPLGIDFGYFNHYGSLMFDLLDQKGDSSIKSEWHLMDSNIRPLEDFDGALGEYISLVKRIYEKNLFIANMKHAMPSYKYLVFTQCLANNCSIQGSISSKVWISNMRQALGSEALFKIQPSPFNEKDVDLSEYRVVFSGGTPKIMNQAIEQNAALASLAGVSVTNTSGISSELLIGEKQVVTTGASWYSGLGVFHEANSWQSLKEICDQVCYTPVDANQMANRLRFANWWRKHQIMNNEKNDKLISGLVKEFKDKN